MRFTLRRRLPRASVAAFLLAALCAAGAFSLVQGLAGRVSAAARGAVPTVHVVVAARAIAPGATVLAEDVSLGAVPGDEPPPGALTVPAEAVGTVAVTPFVPGEAIVTARLATGGGALTAAVPEGQVALTLGIETPPDGLAPGDRVDVLATFTTERPYTSTVAADVRVLRVSSGAAVGLGAGGGATVTLVLDPDAAPGVAQAAATGVVTLAVRGYEPVTSASIGSLTASGPG